MALSTLCLMKELMSSHETSLLSQLKQLHRKRVRQLFFVYGCPDFAESWKCRFVDPRTSTQAVFRRFGSNKVSSYARLKAIARRRGFKNDTKLMTWEIAEKTTIVLFEEAFQSYLNKFFLSTNGQTPAALLPEYISMSLDYQTKFWNLESVKFVEVVID
ncbi:uncharacterized protein LY89DRAFT_733685 [Mollisia scopiformis]|uniref:Uncharacterized protein n=1 Tax=Mollisia scopiformis TaxID=149040 RepID=A0A194X981_MOLSC|nr:uncharacterized protein LY89DRAFT_733685 [Mollisia scopiformis]KUJ16679.1 hypothetical protein LY89DRAFT_733685 [Mollisia scopiformis]